MRIYAFDIDSLTTVQQLKTLLSQKMDFSCDLHAMYFTVQGTILKNHDKTLSEYGIQSDCQIELVDPTVNGRGNFDIFGVTFIDVGDNDNLQRKSWSNSAPIWRICIPGLCLEGLCLNEKCDAHQQRVVVPIGYGMFDLLLDSNETTVVCPLCKLYVEPSICSFNNCWWRYQGIKQNTKNGNSPPKKCSNEWTLADDAYHYFNEESDNLVVWKQLIFEVMKEKPLN